MYYLLRFGLLGLTLHEYEFQSLETAKKAFNIVYTEYNKVFEEGFVYNFTCLLITKGVRNEEAKSPEYRNIKNQCN